MLTAQVVIEFERRTPADEATMDLLADATLDALNAEARFLAFGPVVSVDYERSAVEVQCTVCSDATNAAAADADVEGKIERISNVIRNGLATAEYQSSAERVPASV